MIEITSLDHNGKGIGKLNNKIVFVENALPTEIVDIRIIKEKKNFIEATINRIIKSSINRVDSPCQYFDKCGGCDLLHMKYEDMIKFKQTKIENIVNRYLDKEIKINNIIESNNQFYYRNKVTFQVKEKIGFYDKGDDRYNLLSALQKSTLQEAYSQPLLPLHPLGS